MTTMSARIRRATAALVAASMIGIAGVGALSPATAFAAGVTTDRAYAATTVAPGTSLLPVRGVD